MVLEYRIPWSTPTGGPGVSVLHGRPTVSGADQVAAEELQERARALIDAVREFFPNTVTWAFPGEVIERNTSTGVIEDMYLFGALPPLAGGGAAVPFSAPSGGRIEWLTNAIVNGRRLRGRTYFVPFTTNAYDAGGTLTPTVLLALQTAGLAYISQQVVNDVSPCVWHRPPLPGGSGGSLADIVSIVVPDEATVLRSRRD